MKSFLLLVSFLFLSIDVSYQSLVTDCGKPDRVIYFESAHIDPDPVEYPGNISLSSIVHVMRDLPAYGLVLDLHVDKLEPEFTHIPCIDGVMGSCKYDVCAMIREYPDHFCPFFPPDVECSCPIKAGRYEVKNAVKNLKDHGSAFAKMIEGSYAGNATVIDIADSSELGCFSYKFKVVSVI